MTPTVRSVLIDGMDPSSVQVSNLLADLHIHSLEDTTIMPQPAALSPAACAALRSAVDLKRSTEVDTVDGAAEHQLNLSLDALGSLVGTQAMRSLLELPAAFCQQSADPPLLGARGGREVVSFFVRRYTASTRPQGGQPPEVADLLGAIEKPASQIPSLRHSDPTLLHILRQRNSRGCALTGGIPSTTTVRRLL